MSDVSVLSAAEAPVSRIIEYFPPSGNETTARDCMHGGSSYSKGATIDAGKGVFECSGDKKGTWVKKSESK